MRHEITIWLSLSKNRPHYIESGERLIVEFLKPNGRKNHQLRFIRQFFDYPKWTDVSICSFSINRVVLRKLIRLLEDMRLTL